MSSISFNPNSNIPPQSPNSSNTFPFVSTGTVDSTSKFSILDYGNLIDTNYNEYSDFQWSNEQSNYLILNKLNKILGGNQNSFEINLSSDQITHLAQPFADTAVSISTTDGTNVNDLNNGIADNLGTINSTYRPNGSSVTDPLNQAIAAFRQAVQNYNLAYQTYQSSAKSAADLAAFQQAQADYNTALTAYQSVDFSTLNATPAANDQAATAQLDEAINTYNAAVIAYQNAPTPISGADQTTFDNAKTAYTTAVATYNTYVNSRPQAGVITAYQQAAITYQAAYETYQNSQQTPADYATFSAALSAYRTALTNYQADANSASLPTDQKNQDAATAANDANTASTTYAAAVSTYQTALNVYNALTPPISQTDQDTYNAALAAYQTATTTFTTALSNSNTTLTSYDSDVGGLLLSSTSLNFINDFSVNVSATNTNIHNFATSVSEFNATQIADYPITGTLLQLPSPPFSPTQSDYDFATQSGFTLSTQSSPSGSPTLVNPVSIPTSVNGGSVTISPTYSSDSDYFAPLLSTIPSQQSLNNQATFSAALTLLENYRDYIRYYLRGKNILLPDSYITPTPVTTSNNTAANVPVGVSMNGSNAASPFISSAIADTIFTSLLMQKQLQDTLLEGGGLPTVGAVGSFLSEGAVESSVPVGVFLAAQTQNQASAVNGSVGNNQSTVNLLLALGISGRIADLIQSNDSYKNILEQLKENLPGADPGKISILADALSQGVNIGLAQLGLAIFGQSIGDPNLLAKIVRATGLVNVAPNALLSTPSEVQEVLNNSLVISGLKTVLANQQNVNETLVNAAIINTLKNTNFTTSEQFADALQNELINQGLTNSSAVSLSTLAKGYIDSEVDNRNILDLQVNQQELAAQLVNGATGQTASPQAAGQTVSPQAAQTLTPQEILNALQQLTPPDQNQTIALRDVRDQLVLQLTANGTAGQTAIPVATQGLLAPLNLLPAQGTQIQGSQSVQSEANLKLQLSQEITQNLTKDLGATAAGQVADQVIASIFDQNHSLVDQLNQSITAVNKLGDKSVLDAVTNSFINYMKPTENLYSFIQQILSPAYSIIHATYGAMYQGIIKTPHPLPLDIQE